MVGARDQQLLHQLLRVLDEVEGAVGGLLGHRHDVVEAGAGIGQLAHRGVDGGDLAERFAEALAQLGEPLHQGLLLPLDDGAQFGLQAGVVGVADRGQRGAQVGGDFRVARRVGHAALPRRSKILSSFSFSVAAVKGLMM